MAKAVSTATRPRPTTTPVRAVSPLTEPDDSDARLERFVTLAAEGRDTKEIATACGYTEGTIRVYRSRYRDRIRQAAEDLLATDVPGLLHGLKLMAQDKDTPANVRLQAHRDLLDRAGMATVRQVNIGELPYATAWERLVAACEGDEDKAKRMKEAFAEIFGRRTELDL